MVTLLAFGRRGYAYAAANMVASLRYHGHTGPIHLHVGRALRPYVDELVPDDSCTKHELADEYAADPGWCKVNLANIFKGKETLYLDVDGVCLKDITPLIEALRKDGRSYMCSVLGKGGVSDSIGYFEWSTPQKVAEKHGLNDATYYGIQSSWSYFKRGDWLDAFSTQVLAAWVMWDVKELKHKWGVGKPDELFYSIACSVMGYDPSFENVIHFGKGFDPLPKVREGHYFLSLYGIGKGRGSVPPRYVDCYDAEGRTISKRYPFHKAELIRRDKYANFKN